MRKLLAELKLQIRFWGVQGLVRSFHYAALATLAQLRRRRPSGPFETVGRPLRWRAMNSGARIAFERAELTVTFLRADLVRLTWQPGVLPVPYACVTEHWPEVSLAREESEEGWSLTSEDMRLELSRDGRLRLFDSRGALLREEFPPERRGEEWLHRARLRDDERAYGLGEHTGPLDLRGSKRRLWNSDPLASYGPDRSPLYMNIPVYLGLHSDGGYLTFFENSYPATVTFDRPQAGQPDAVEQGEAEARALFEGGALRYYLIPGTPERSLRRYSELTGRPPLPPRWALGYHQSRFSYADEAQVREVADGFLDRNLPLSAIHLDIHYMDGFRVFTVDRKSFPDLAGLVGDLTERGVRLVVILDPGVKRDPEYRVFREGLEQRMFSLTERGEVALGPVWPGWSAFPDFTDSRVREWWASLHAELLEAGVSGFWNDMNEPTLTALWGERALAHDVKHAFDGRGGDHFEAHNLYGLLMVRSGYEGLRRLAPERRPFIISRSGWAGIQRYAWTWTGDISSSWPMLHQTVATVLGLGLSGMPYSGPDIGGFKGALDDELYERWFELATFLPFFRTHSALVMGPREPWRFGEEVLERVRGLLELRRELTPYLYTLAWEASETGHPLVRPLFWAAPENPSLTGIDDAFLLGEGLLVAPILERATASRSLVLPPGRWYGFWDDLAVEGAGEVSGPLGRPPLFVAAGAVLPLERDGALELHLYAPSGASAGGVLYSDEGDGYGPHRIDRFAVRRDDRTLRVRWEEEGEFRFPYRRVVLQVHGAVVNGLEVDGRALEVSSGRAETGVFGEVAVALGD